MTVTLPNFTLASPTRAPNTVDPAGDADNAIKTLQALSSMQNALNTGNAGGADTQGINDSTAAINAALATGSGWCHLPEGTFLLNGSSGITVPGGSGKIRGVGYGLTTILVGPAFTGPAAITASGVSLIEIEGCAVIGANTGTVSNLGGTSAWDAISLTGAARCKVSKCWFQYVNGWAIESVSTSGTANVDSMFDSLVIRNSAAAIHIQGVAGSSNNGEQFVSNVNMQQMGTTTGPSANLDALFWEDTHDVLTSNTNIGVPNGTGHTLHIKGVCATCYFVAGDWGQGSGVLIENNGTGGSATDIQFDACIFQQSTSGAGFTITGAAGDIKIANSYFHGNQTNGLAASNTGNACQLVGCEWNTNGQGTTGLTSYYDLELASCTAKWFVTGGILHTTVGTSAGNVLNPVHDPNSVATFTGTAFIGTNTTTSNFGAVNYFNCTVTTSRGLSMTMTGPGDMVVGGTGGAPVRVAGNTGGTKQYLSETGGVASFGTIAATDIVHDGLFGNGSDGAITFDGLANPVAGATLSGSTYTLTRDIQATSITINGSVIVKPANFRIFAQGTLTNNGTISYTGANASAGAPGAGIGGSASLVSNAPGGAGGTGVSGAGASGTARNFGPAGGAGGAGTSGAAGTAATPAQTGTALTANVLTTPYPLTTNLVNYANTTVALSWGAGGSGGGSDASSNAGGGGGAAGGIIVIFAWSLNNGGGTITVAGGNGANGTSGNAGGGGGGTGGLIVAVTLSAWTAGTMTVTGGAKGNHSGTGSDGNAGSNGTALNLVAA